MSITITGNRACRKIQCENVISYHNRLECIGRYKNEWAINTIDPCVSINTSTNVMANNVQQSTQIPVIAIPVIS